MSGPCPGPGRFWAESRWQLLAAEEIGSKGGGGIRRKRQVLGKRAVYADTPK